MTTAPLFLSSLRYIRGNKRSDENTKRTGDIPGREEMKKDCDAD